MTTILFTDTHFGIKQNSITWFNSQKDFIVNQLIPYIKTIDDDVRLVHLGDVFDSRSTISTYIATNVVELFKELKSNVKEFIVIGGNHDYYSPTTDRIDTLNLLLNNLDITLVTQQSLISGHDMFIPWYQWLEYYDKMMEFVKEYNIKNIYTHADIVTNPPQIPGVKIYSGHIHTPKIVKGLFNLGSCYNLDFSDSNGDRGFYVISNDDKFLFIKNTKSLTFKRLYNDDIFNPDIKINKNDYIEIYLLPENLQNEQYIEKIAELSKLYKNMWVIPQYYQESTNNSCDINIEKYDIEEMTRKNIPPNLLDKFNQILNNMNN